jgi:AraC family transcriptional regulator
MNYTMSQLDWQQQPALVVRGKVGIENAGEAISSSIEAVVNFLEAKKLNPVGAPFTRTYSFENGVLEFEAGFPVLPTTKGDGNIIATELPQAKVVSTVHVGPQETSENAYKAIHAWMAQNGKSPAGAPWEVYLTDPATTPEANAQTRIYFPYA